MRLPRRVAPRNDVDRALATLTIGLRRRVHRSDMEGRDLRQDGKSGLSCLQILRLRSG